MQLSALLSGGLLVISLAACQSGTFSESIVGSGLLGDHFGVPSFNGSFDYVVIGGGTAGLAIASRLAGNGSHSVAVIEKGSFYELDNGNFSTVPGTAGYFVGTAPFTFNSLIDWEYQTQPIQGLGGRSILYNSGKTLGGGSARNYMVYDRGSRGSYQMWADQVNDPSYTFDQFLPYFQHSITFDAPNQGQRIANATSGLNPTAIGNDNGPVQVTLPNWANAVGTWAARALDSLGLKELPGLVSGDLMGYSYATQTIDGQTQTRSSSETSYLRNTIKNPSNLVVYQSTLAKRITFGTNGAANGVVVNSGDSDYFLAAQREVIVSAGAHRSPQLLMLSGVGPRATLQGLGIPVLSDLPGVGQNMWDQPFFGPSWPVSLQTHSALAADPAFLASQTAAYRTSRTGMLTNSGSDFIAWEDLPTDLLRSLSNSTQADLAKTFPQDWPTIQHTFADAFFGYGRDMLIGAPTDGRMYASILPALVATFSRGNVTINSTDPLAQPVISPNFLNDVRDQEIAVAAFKRARQIANTTAFRTIIAGDETFPGANVTSDADILEVIRQSATPIWHASGTCKMGAPNDTLAVVDSQARVRGVQGLRVVDASAFPFLVPCHPSATVYALAEKIADVILNGS